MKSIGKHAGMVIAAALLLAAGLATAGLRPALGQQPEMVTLCHAAGQAGTTQFVTLTIAYNAAFGPAGHFNEDGTPRAGHEQDYLGACTTDTTTTETTTTETTTTTDTTTTTETTETTTTTTPPPPPPGPRCPPGMEPTAGKDGEPGNDECEFPPGPPPTVPPVVTQPETTTTTTTTDPQTTTDPPTETTAPPETTTTTSQPPAPKPPKVKPPNAGGPPQPPKAGKKCPAGTRLANGKCHGIVQGSG